MFSSRYLNNTLNNIHEPALQLIYNNHEKSFIKEKNCLIPSPAHHWDVKKIVFIVSLICLRF